MKEAPEDPGTFIAQSVLGAVLLGQEKYAEAEPLLLQGYKGLKQREAKLPANLRELRLREAVERLVQLYEAWNRNGEAATWRQELQGMKASKQAGKSKPQVD
jgi:hypothetical protein